MTGQQENHLKSIKEEFTDLVDAKYRKGAKEHGGTLSDMPTKDLLDNAIDEAIDQVVYLLTLKRSMQ